MKKKKKYILKFKDKTKFKVTVNKEYRTGTYFSNILTGFYGPSRLYLSFPAWPIWSSPIKLPDHPQTGQTGWLHMLSERGSCLQTHSNEKHQEILTGFLDLSATGPAHAFSEKKHM